jgi:hypothetical protein
MLTLGGETQKILLPFKRLIAKATPTDIVAGREGGTVIVTKTRNLSIIWFLVVPYSIRLGNVAIDPRIPTIPIIPTKISESR